RLPRTTIGPLVAKSLEHLLDHGQAGRDLVEIDEGTEIERTLRTEELDPDRGVDEDHEARFFEGRSLLIDSTSPSHRPDPRSSRIWRAFTRRTKSSSARVTAAE